MPTLDEIEDQVDMAKLYYIQEANAQRVLLQTGCGDITILSPLKRLITALTFQISAAVNDDTTLVLYKCLQRIINNFSAPYVVDPTVKVPGDEVVVVYVETAVEREYDEDFLIDGDPPNGLWYLPLVYSKTGPVPQGARPALVTINNQSFSFTYNDSFTPARIYGFGDNSTQTIKVTYVTT